MQEVLSMQACARHYEQVFCCCTLAYKLCYSTAALLTRDF